MLTRLAQRSVATVQASRKTVSPTKRFCTTEPAIGRVKAKELYWALRAPGQKFVLIDIRPAEKFQLYNIVGTTNVPASTFKPEQVADLPKDAHVYIIAEPDQSLGPIHEQIATAIKDVGVTGVSMVDADVDKLREIGFYYYMDTEGERLRIEKEKAEELAKAAAQKK